MSYDKEYLEDDLYNYKYLTQDDVCRLCWREDAEREITSKPITVPKNKGKDGLLEKILYTLNLTIDPAVVPNKICEECHELIEKFYNFKLFCKASNRKLLEVLADGYKPPPEPCIVPIEVPKPEIKIEQEYKVEISNDITELEVEDTHSVGGYESEDLPLIKSSVKKKKRKYTYRPKDYPSSFCRSCNIDCDTDEKFMQHNEKIHQHIREGGFRCFGCDRKFKTRRQRVCHELNFCKGLKKGYLCDVCGRYIPKRRMYERHMIKHIMNRPIDLPDEIFKCNKCKDMFKSKECLFKHIEDVHTVEQNFVCELCGRVFTRMDYLNKHMTVHTGVKKHECRLCGYRATQKSSLNVHMRKHTGEKPFACDLCPIRCLTSSNLIAHKLRHAGIKKFECALCPKKFGYKGSLEEHISSTHDKVKWFTCTICNTSYARSGGLRRHIRTKHGEKEAEDEKAKIPYEVVKNLEFNANFVGYGAHKVE